MNKTPEELKNDIDFCLDLIDKQKLLIPYLTRKIARKNSNKKKTFAMNEKNIKSAKLWLRNEIYRIYWENYRSWGPVDKNISKRKIALKNVETLSNVQIMATMNKDYPGGWSNFAKN